MPIERHFLGWNEPITARVRDFLLPEGNLHNIPLPDLTKDLIVVPTRQAGRLLGEALALHCDKIKTALLPPRIVTPAYFLYPEDEKTNIANPTEVTAIWDEILMRSDLNQYPGLFPARKPEQDFSWAMHMAQTLQNLRDELADGGYQIANVVEQYGEILEEPERWGDLSRLETAYLKRLTELERRDPIELMIERSENPNLPNSIERIVIAGVADPTPLMIRALGNLVTQIPIDILIHAPQSKAGQFDEWGRPIATEWQKAQIDIPDPETNLLLAGSPASQTHKTLNLIASEQARFGPGDIAIGVPDSEVIPSMAAKLAEKGLPTFNPAGKAIKEHPLFQLLDSYHALIGEESYGALSALLRHADILEFLQKKCDLSTLDILAETDRFQNYYLPVSFENVSSQLRSEPAEKDFPSLNIAVSFLDEQLEYFRDNEFNTALRHFLQTVYESRTLNQNYPEDREFSAVAKSIDAALRELESDCINALGIEKRNLPDLLLQRLSGQKYYPEREDTVIDLEGWLELPWEDAPMLIVTGMNEGFVPNTRMSDLFLPDSLRKHLNLNHDEDHLAIDTFLMTGLIESRRQNGRVCFIAGKASSAGDHLKPSRLLFRCEDTELPQRAAQLFGDAEEERDNHPATISFLLNPTPPADFPADKVTLKKLSVTAFKDYLACPFRFYLKHILGMEELDDQKTELDAMDFGSLVHETLNEMAQNQQMNRCENEKELTRFLQSRAEEWVIQRFGQLPPLQVKTQLEAARQRLAAAAKVQSRLTGEGWQIIRAEMQIKAQLNGMTVSGRIDRIDRNRQTGQIRILDYKTSDRADPPEVIHLKSPSQDTPDFARIPLGKKERCWADLQLPLYRILLPDEMLSDGPVQIGYFNLPKAIGETGVSLWEEFSEELLARARECAEGIIESIQHRKFWPPTSKVSYDDFEHLFPAEIADCIDTKSFAEFMNQNV